MLGALAVVVCMVSTAVSAAAPCQHELSMAEAEPLEPLMSNCWLRESSKGEMPAERCSDRAAVARAHESARTTGKSMSRVQIKTVVRDGANKDRRQSQKSPDEPQNREEVPLAKNKLPDGGVE